MSTPAKDDYLVSKGYAWYVFTLLFIFMLLDFTDRQIVASVFPYLKAEWSLSDTELGMLASMTNWAMAVVVVPVSVMMDRWSRKWGVAIMVGIWSSASLGCALSGSYGQLLACRAVAGTGEGGYGPGGGALIGALFPKRMLAGLMGFFFAGCPLGGIIGTALGGFIAVHFGWRYAFGIMAIPGLLLAVLFALTVKDYKTVALTVTDKSSGSKKKASFKEIVAMFTKTPTLLLVYVGFSAQMFGTVAVLNWLPSFFNRTQGLAMDQAGLKASLVFLCAACGTITAGFLVDKIRVKRPSAILLLSACFSLCNALLFVYAFTFLEGTAQYAALLIGGFGLNASQGPSYAVCQQVVHPGLRTTSLSLLTLCQQLLGQAPGPLFTGIFSDSYGLSNALAITSLAPLLAALAFIIAAYFYKRDIAKVEQVELSIAA